MDAKTRGLLLEIAVTLRAQVEHEAVGRDVFAGLLEEVSAVLGGELVDGVANADAAMQITVEQAIMIRHSMRLLSAALEDAFADYLPSGVMGDRWEEFYSQLVPPNVCIIVL